MDILGVFQGAVRILLSPNGLDSPGSFIRVDSTGSSPMSRFVTKMNDYLYGNAELDVFSIKVKFLFFCSVFLCYYFKKAAGLGFVFSESSCSCFIDVFMRNADPLFGCVH